MPSFLAQLLLQVLGSTSKRPTAKNMRNSKKDIKDEIHVQHLVFPIVIFESHTNTTPRAINPTVTMHRNFMKFDGWLNKDMSAKVIILV